MKQQYFVAYDGKVVGTVAAASKEGAIGSFMRNGKIPMSGRRYSDAIPTMELMAAECGFETAVSAMLLPTLNFQPV